ncbi:MAG: transcription-repair coupling factor [Lachnospiraceae bacterium]|nr:transcription-repair coupling factor [Lachnospiraceae bacterium]
MGIFGNPLRSLLSYEIIEERRKKTGGVIQLSGSIDAVKPCLVNGLSTKKNRLLITYSEIKARELLDEYRMYDREVMYYPAKDVLFYQADVRGNLLTTQRLSVLKRMNVDVGLTIITTFDALMDRLIAPEEFYEYVLTVRSGEDLDIDDFKKKLVMMGYEKNYQVERPGDFAIRGGIIDIYPISEELPYRIELWDTEVDSIRRFDIESQRSVEDLSEIKISPSTELILTDAKIEKGLAAITKEGKTLSEKFKKALKADEMKRIIAAVEEVKDCLESRVDLVTAETYLTYFYEETATFLDYVDLKNTDIFVDEPVRTIEKGNAVFLEYSESMKNRLESGYILSGQAKLLRSVKETAERLSKNFLILLSTLDQTAEELMPKDIYNVNAKSISAYNKSFELLLKDLKRYKKAAYKTVIVSPSRSRAERLAQDITNEGITATFVTDINRVVKEGEVIVYNGKLKKGYEFPQIGFAVITESDIFGEEHKKRKKKVAHDGEHIREFSDLKIGDYVVHENHGLGIYRGIEKVEVDKVVKDYIKIEYDKGGVLYIQANNLDVLQKYAGADAKRPKINTLGSKEWNNTKQRVRSAVADIAADLVKLYAIRENVKGFEFSPDSIWQKEFEEAFPFEETEGQLAAIEAVKSDMESSKAMDRLICGDVGFGKTEIALRAAFKAVQDSKQVVYLVPTTILAEQHYNTFAQRMKDFPVRVDLLCRFRSPAEQKKTLEALRRGDVDIVIGTHRLLSKDVQYKDLGLLIIDEEQRFGVAHKEKIKSLKNKIDVLTLTATPIPRTLHMSLVGIRDMSVLEEAPTDRMPIQTYVMEYNEEMVREAINRELARNGQVYYVFNKVRGIQDVTDRIAALCPEANVAYAHGQMNERELEDIMYSFINGDIDVLVSTTIIETGLDISNVNTIIIEDAENFGLSQLYQLRGRVGRSNRTSFAFLMYKRDKMLKEVAEKRLHAMKEFTELGSGIRIALKDLEIRGAGNILGADQSGHMEAVGYDLYCKMLHEAVRMLSGEDYVESFETSIDIAIDAYIPADYIGNEFQKLDMYKRIANIENEQDKADMMDELIDRFGEPGKAVLNLLDVAVIKAYAHKCYISDVKEKEADISLTMYEKARIKVEAIPEFLASFEGAMIFNAKNKPPAFIFNKEYNTKTKTLSNMEILDIVFKKFEEVLI